MMDKNYKVMAIILGTQNEERRVGEFNKCKIYQRQNKPRKTEKTYLTSLYKWLEEQVPQKENGVIKE